MRNEVVGAVLFLLLIIGIIAGILFNRLELFGFISLSVGLGIVLIFRRKN